MANQEQLDLLKQGIKAWNNWRYDDAGFGIQPDLSYTNLCGSDLRGADLHKANLTSTDLSGANLSEANFNGADLRGANLNGADLNGAELIKANFWKAELIRTDLRGANFNGADLSEADLSGANLRQARLDRTSISDASLEGADLSGATLYRATLVRTNLMGATLTNCEIYGISAWNVKLEGARQTNLNISAPGEPPITVDNLDVAQFVYLLLNNAKIREVINTLTTKAVLILGRFTPARKATLDTLREELRKHNYVPILFDFEKPIERNYTETIRTLAHLARFIIADLTEPSSIPQELQAIVPTLAVPVQPILLEGKREYAMFVDLLKTYEWVLPITFYADQSALLTSLQDKIIRLAEDKAKELEKKRN